MIVTDGLIYWFVGNFIMCLLSLFDIVIFNRDGFPGIINWTVIPFAIGLLILRIVF